MITPEDFYKRWSKDEDPLVKYNSQIINQLNLPENAKAFLINAGLPDSAAPFLSFVGSQNDGGKRVSQLSNIKALSKYIYLGCTGSGDPICVVEPTGNVVILDHEDNSQNYMNTSIPQLAESLLEFSDFMDIMNQEDNEISFQGEFENLKNKLNDIDSPALENEFCFWSVALEQLFEDYEEENELVK